MVLAIQFYQLAPTHSHLFDWIYKHSNLICETVQFNNKGRKTVNISFLHPFLNVHLSSDTQ